MTPAPSRQGARTPHKPLIPFAIPWLLSAIVLLCGAQNQCGQRRQRPQRSICQVDADCGAERVCDTDTHRCIVPDSTDQTPEDQTPEDQPNDATVHSHTLGYGDGRRIKVRLSEQDVAYEEHPDSQYSRSRIQVLHPDLGSQTFALEVLQETMAQESMPQGHEGESQNGEAPKNISVNLMGEGGSHYRIEFSPRSIQVAYGTGQFEKLGGFDHDHHAKLRQAFIKHASIDSPEGTLPVRKAVSTLLESNHLNDDSPELWWGGYPLHRVALSALHMLHALELSSIDATDLILFTWLYAPQMSQLDAYENLKPWDYLRHELAGTFRASPPPPPQEAPAHCLIPDQQHPKAGGLNANVGPVTAKISVGEVAVTVMRQPTASLKSKAWMNSWNANPVDASTCPGTHWYQWGETKVEADIDLGAQVWCAGPGKCCKNGPDDKAISGVFELKLGAEGITAFLPTDEGDALGGLSQVKGKAWLCYDEDIAFDDYLGSGHSLKIQAELF